MQDAGFDAKNLPDDEKKKTASPVRRQMQRALEKWADVESRIRRRMRIYPKKLRGVMTSREIRELEIDESDLRLPPGGSEPSCDPEFQPRPKPIISIRGRDLTEHDQEKEHDQKDDEFPLAS